MKLGPLGMMLDPVKGLKLSDPVIDFVCVSVLCRFNTLFVSTVVVVYFTNFVPVFPKRHFFYEGTLVPFPFSVNWSYYIFSESSQ